MRSFPTNAGCARNALRAELRRRRNAVSQATARTAAQAACESIIRSEQFQAARSVAGYIPVRGEIDPGLVLQRALEHGKQVLLPLVIGAGDMIFAPWSPNTPMARNRFGIPEPVVRNLKPTPPQSLDMVVVPLLGFDLRGTRLGTGAGFYDRAFAFKRRKPGQPPWLVGIAYALQKCDKLDAAEWDVPLDFVALESGILQCPTACP